MPFPDDQHAAFGLGRTVAVIGAGISGVCAAAHLMKQGLRVTVFERSSIAGGVWHYEERVSKDSPYPNSTPSSGDYRISQHGEFAYAAPPPQHHTDGGDADLESSFSPPGPCYAGLKNNVPTPLMVTQLGPWPEGTETFVSQKNIEEYVQQLSIKHSVNAVTLFHTRVDEVRRTLDGCKWRVRSVTMKKEEAGTRFVEKSSDFDLVVVASGHYNMPRIPDIEGLKEWKASYPRRVIHSKQYRSPGKYRDQNVLVIGAGVSALDICRELDGVANKTYQSVRGGDFDIPAHLMPENVVRVPEIDKFLPHGCAPDDRPARDKEAAPGFITLKDGQTLNGIHQVILATGYIVSYPFLSRLHSDNAPITEAGEELLVTSEGCMTHNLHRDIFYINDPTLAFVGVPYYVATFSLFDFQAQAVARVFAGKARLPSREEMRKEYEKRVEQKGLGRAFHSLHARGLETEYVQELVDWVNHSGAGSGEPPMRPHSEEWKRDYDVMKARLTAAFKLPKDGEKSEARSGAK